MSKAITYGIHLHSLFIGMKYVVIWSPQYVYCVCNNCRFYKHIILSIRIKTSPNSNLWKNSSRAQSPELWPLMRRLAATNSKSRQNIWFQLGFLKKYPLHWGNQYSLSFVYMLLTDFSAAARKKNTQWRRLSIIVDFLVAHAEANIYIKRHCMLFVHF